MRETSGTLKYDYTIRIDLEDIVERLMEKISSNVDDYEWEADCNVLEIRCKDECRLKNTHYDATRYDPAEDDTELFGSIDEVDVEQALLDVLHETKRIRVDVDADYENAEFVEDEPDEDAIYDAWRDRQFEEE